MTQLWGKVSARAVRDRRLSAEALRVLATLAVHVGEKGCYPSIATLAEWAGTGQRVILHHLRRLEDLGYVVTTKRSIPGDRRRSNSYRLVYVAVNDLQSGDASSDGDDLQSGDASSDGDVQCDSATTCNRVTPKQNLEQKRGRGGDDVQSGDTSSSAAPIRARASARPAFEDAVEFASGTEIPRALVDHIRKVSGRSYFDALSVAKRAAPRDIHAAWAALTDQSADRTALAALVRDLR